MLFTYFLTCSVRTLYSDPSFLGFNLFYGAAGLYSSTLRTSKVMNLLLIDREKVANGCICQQPAALVLGPLSYSTWA
jgi:hypothetical protein